MNSDYSDDMDLLQLERELQTLTPAAPRLELVQAIKARMEPVPRIVQPAPRMISFPWRRMVAPAAAAAAAVAVMNFDGTRRSTRPQPVAVNEPAPAVKWEPMPMLPQYRALLDEGYVLTGDMQFFIPPGLASTYNQSVRRVPAENANTAVRDTMPGQNRFIVPAGYGSQQMRMRWN